MSKPNKLYSQVHQVWGWQEIEDQLLQRASEWLRGQGAKLAQALLWLYDLLQPFEDLADPLKDKEGLTLAAANENQRARKSGGLDNDF